MDIIGNVLTFLNNNLGFVTILGALFVILVYFRQQMDHKIEVAKIILQEIRYAEKQIKIARERNNSFLLTNTLLPTNNWYKNISLFVNDLEQADIDAISDFYSKVSFLDKIINYITDFKVNRIIPSLEKQMADTVPAAQSAVGGSKNETTQQKQIIKIQLFAEVALKEVADQVEFLYNTPAADKLRKISQREWYKFRI